MSEMRGEGESMSAVTWLIMHWELVLTILLVIFIGIPFMVVMIIPSIIYIASRRKWIPTLEWMIQYFKVDINQPPYSEWMDKHPLIFVCLTSVELYTSYYLIYLIRGIKWGVKKTVVGTYKLLKIYVKHQWDLYDKWNKEIEKEEKKRGAV
jgi:hypothetical protein